MALLLGIDVGTSSAKAVLFDPDTARILALASREYPIRQPAPDRAEQDPEDWWRAAVECVREITAHAARRDVAAIGFSGQMHGTVLLDAASQPLHPAIIWPDRRAAREAADLTAAVEPARYVALAGTLPAVGFMGPTLLWLRRHQPRLLESAARVILVKDYVRLKMTGEAATDITDAAATALFDVTARAWSPELLAAAGIPDRLMPPLLQSTDVAGTLLPQAAETLGLPLGIPVVAGCADQPAQAIGNGILAPGLASVTTGSGGQVLTPLTLTGGSLRTDPRLHVFNHAVRDTWYVLGAILAAGLNLRWLRGITGLDAAPDAYARFSAEAGRVPPGADGLIYLPYLYGERTPHMDPAARGAFIGLSAYHTRAHLARAVMEGVAFALRDALELSLALGASVETVIAAGGGSESDVWRQIQADVFGLPLRRSLLQEQASVGAALLAGVGAGVYSDLDQACRQVVRYGPLTEPDVERHRLYNDIYAQYRELYPRLRADFNRLSNRTRGESGAGA